MITSSIVTVGPTATLLFTAPGAPTQISTVYLSALGVYLGDLFIGASNVTPQNGYHYLQSGVAISVDGGDSLYGVALSTNLPVSVMAITDGASAGTVDQGTGGASPWLINAAQFGGTNVSTGVGAAGAGIPRVTVSNDSNVLVTPPTLVKGTQGATGFSTQPLSDAGRNQTNFFMAASIAGTSAEVMQSLTGYKSGAAVGATATPAVVTAGKTYRINAISMSYQSLAGAGAMMFRLRANTAGVAIISSPLVMNWTLGSNAAVAGVTQTIVLTDSWEFAAGTGIAVGMVGLNTVGAAAAAGFGTITLSGYEY